MGDKLFNEWRVYEKLLIHDYMDHRAFFDRLRDEINTRFLRPVSILDLGCGDLTPVLPLLRSTPLERYVGIDESEVALTIARERLAELTLPAQVRHGDLLAALAGLDGPFDVILASFALHHLADPADKRATFAACRKLLDPAGFLAIIDVFSAEHEPRARYLERWIQHAEQRYTALKPPEKQLLFDHVRARDYPVSLAHCQTLGHEAGLDRFEVLLDDTPRLNHLVTLAASRRTSS